MAPSGTQGRLGRTIQLSAIAALIVGILGGVPRPRRPLSR